MPAGQVLEFNRVTKRFGAVTAVSDLSVRVEPGAVTGFLGPNGAGKTTTLRMLLGQIRPTSGTATIGGATYAELRHPLRTIGAVLEEAAYRPRRTAARQLLIAAKANGIPTQRVDEVLRLVGLQDDADTRIGGYSLGMRQRLSVATALLGDPGALVLDEPANGLDPEGIRWMRLLMRRLADEGRTVLVSSHVLSEIEQVADNVVVLSKGRAVYSGSIDDLADPTTGAVIVDAEDRDALAAALAAAGLGFDVLRSGLTVRESDAAAVGAVAAAAGIALSTLQQRGPSLEEVFLDLVYGRRADSPRLDEVANPVAHAPLSADAEGAPADAALVAGGAPLASAAAVVGAGAPVGAAGADAEAEATETDDAEHADAEDAATEAETSAAVDAASTEAQDEAGAVTADESAVTVAEPASAGPAEDSEVASDDAGDADRDAAAAGHEGTATTDADRAEDDAAEADGSTREGEALETDDSEGTTVSSGVAEASDEVSEDAPSEGEADGRPAEEPEVSADGERSEATEQSESQAEPTGDAERASDEAVPSDDATEGQSDRDEHGEQERPDGDGRSRAGEQADARNEDAEQGDEHLPDEAPESDAEHGHAEGNAEHDGDVDDHASFAAEGDEPGGHEEEQPSTDDTRTAVFSVPSDLWGPRPAASVTEAEPGRPESEQPESEQPESEQPESEQPESEQADSDRPDSDHPDSEQPDSDEVASEVLPLATQAVSIPMAADQTTFTELITGIPAAPAAEEGAPSPTEPQTTTQAFAVFAPILSADDEDDTDSTVDDADDPRLAAMRTSLSAAASRFFEGPAPDYPFGDVTKDQTEQPAEEAQPAEGDDDATRVIDAVPGPEVEQHDDGGEHDGEHHHGDHHHDGDHHHGEHHHS